MLNQDKIDTKIEARRLKTQDEKNPQQLIVQHENQNEIDYSKSKRIT